MDQFVLIVLCMSVLCMSVPFSHQYSTTLRRTLSSRARRAQIEATPRPALHGTPSPELDGDADADAWSPEHMLLSSLGLCMLTTFEAFAVRDRIEVLSWQARVSGTVEQTPEGPMFASIVLELDIVITGNVAQFEDTLEDAKRYCLVQNALRVPVVIETELHTPFDPPDEVGEAPPPPKRHAPPQLHANSI